jgi:Protein of unknown function (DUF3306)
MASNHNDGSPEDGFLSRWSKRKLEARGAATAPPLAPVQDEAAIEPAATAPEPVDDTPLPSLDDITPTSDIAAFLHSRVPAELQKLALRKAWALDPQISGFIEVAENQYDFNVPDSIPGFGDFAPGTDLSAMIAHALGEGPPPVEPEPEQGVMASGEPSVAEQALPEETPAVAVSQAPGDDAAFVGDDGSTKAPRSDAPLKLGPIVAAGLGETTAATTSAADPLARPRRHGGALPA